MRKIEKSENVFLLKSLSIVLLPWILLAIIFGLFDLEISNLVVDFSSVWATFGADFGEAPGYALIGISIVSLIGGLIKKVKLQKIPAFVISAAGMGVMLYGLITSERRIVIISGIITFSILIFAIVKFHKDWKSYRRFAGIIVLLAIFNPLIFVQITKLLCGRVRYRELVNIGFEFYRPWYSPLGPTLEHASFPSGHTAMGWMLLPLIIYIREKKLDKSLKIYLITTIIYWGLFVAVSRVIVGAHFASDVLFSTGMAFIVTIFLYYFFYLKKKPSTDSY
ncbi:MAG: phosphatase PAP2 family protein [Candidatus Heimdallarchaeota archaeon]